MINIVDSHCHLYYEPYISNLNKVVQDCREEGIFLMLTIGVDYETSLKNIEISKQFKEIYCTVGLHPNNVNKKKQDLENIFSLIDKKNNKIIGIGECGIDLFRSTNINEQIEYFEKHVIKSISTGLPLIIHTRNSDNEILNVLQKYKNKNLKFIIHCFSSNYVFAKKCIDLGGLISFGGLLTFKKNNSQIQEVCKKICINKILVETDSPYLSPHPLRGKTNHPKNTKIILEEISRIRGIDLIKISEITSQNFQKFFNLSIL